MYYKKTSDIGRFFMFALKSAPLQLFKEGIRSFWQLSCILRVRGASRGGQQRPSGDDAEVVEREWFSARSAGNIGAADVLCLRFPRFVVAPCRRHA